jgi:hypothetical protein
MVFVPDVGERHKGKWFAMGSSRRYPRATTTLYYSCTFVFARTIAAMPILSECGKSGHAATILAKSGHFRAKSAKKHAKIFASDS